VGRIIVLCKPGSLVLTLIRCRGCQIRDDNFWSDISRANIHNLQTSGSELKIVRLPQKGGIIYKAEVVRAANKEAKDNPRFVVTNLKQSPQWIYEKTYCGARRDPPQNQRGRTIRTSSRHPRPYAGG